MNRNTRTALIFIGNVVILYWLLRVIEDDLGDKSQIVFVFWYPIIITGNLYLKKYNNDIKPFINVLSIIMGILFIPLLIIVVEYL